MVLGISQNLAFSRRWVLRLWFFWEVMMKNLLEFFHFSKKPSTFIFMRMGFQRWKRGARYFSVNVVLFYQMTRQFYPRTHSCWKHFIIFDNDCNLFSNKLLEETYLKIHLGTNRPKYKKKSVPREEAECCSPRLCSSVIYIMKISTVSNAAHSSSAYEEQPSLRIRNIYCYIQCCPNCNLTLSNQNQSTHPHAKSVTSILIL
jgi:hypothetical protein